MKNYIFVVISLSYFVLISFYNYIFDSNIYIWNLSIYNIISYLDFLMVFLWVFGFLWFFSYLAKKLKEKYLKNLKYSNIIFEAIIKFINISKYIIAIYIWSKFINFPENISKIVDKIFKVSFIFFALIFISSLVSSFFKILLKERRKNNLSKQIFPILSKFIIFFIWVIWILTILWNLGYNISALVAWAWVWWIAIALAAQKTVANIFWAISVLINKPFEVWESITIWNYTWTVNEIWLTYLELIKVDWNKVLIPNENIISSPIENLTQRDNRKVEFIIWLIYETSVEELKTAIKIIENILEKHQKDEKIESYRVIFDNFWVSSLDIKITYFSIINDSLLNHLKNKENINFEIKKQFDAKWLIIAFNTQEIRLKNI